MEKQWVFHSETTGQVAAEGVTRHLLAYCKELMCVENHFKAGAVGALHQHPHTQITYVVKGVFAFTIDGVTKTVRPGDSMYKKGSTPHGCRCIEEGILLDVFTPMREDFVD